MNRLSGKTALVTGGGAGIGRAIAIRFALEGARVAVTDVDSANGKDTVNEITAAGATARFWTLDVQREAQVRQTIDRVVAEWGRIDTLVNNAGIMGPNKPTHEVSAQEWKEVMAINVDGVFFCTKAVIPHMVRAGGGSIINLCAAYGTVGAPNAPGVPCVEGRGPRHDQDRCGALRPRRHSRQLDSSELCPDRNVRCVSRHHAGSRGR